jgi:hypothetical protein
MVQQVPDLPVTPAPLMQLATAHWAFKTLAAAHEIDLFTYLSRSSGGATVEELAIDSGIERRPAEILLTACASLGLLTKEGERFRNAPLSEEFLVRGKRYYFGGFIQMQDRLIYPAYGRLGEAVRRNRPTAYDPDRQHSMYEGGDPDIVANFWEAMHSLSSITARALADAFDFSTVRRVLDVGGGSAAFDIELCRRYPRLLATVYDLPFVTEIARQKIDAADLGSRIGLVAGNFFVDPELPGGHDLLLLSMILHGEPEERNLELLRKCYAALPSGGRILVSELLVNDEKTGPVPAALMNVTMLVATEGGRNYTGSEYTAMLRAAGFQEVAALPFQGLGANGLVVGRRP